MELLLSSIFLGIVEGVTEYIPVSSTGHLILFGTAIGFDAGGEGAFEVFIQLGAILAVLVLYTGRFTGLLDFSGGYQLREERGFTGLQGLTKLGLACLPAFVLGFLFHEFIKSHLFSPLPVAAALIFGGIVMVFIDRIVRAQRIETLEDISYARSFGIGLFQCFALWPGMSRSGSTIVGGMILGLDKKIAAEFSFLVAVPVMFAAVTYDMWKNFGLLSADDIMPFAVGFLVSFITAVVSIKFLMEILKRYSLAPIGYYRIVVGILVLLLIWQW